MTLAASLLPFDGGGRQGVTYALFRPTAPLRYAIWQLAEPAVFLVIACVCVAGFLIRSEGFRGVVVGLALGAGAVEIFSWASNVVVETSGSQRFDSFAVGPPFGVAGAACLVASALVASSGTSPAVMRGTRLITIPAVVGAAGLLAGVLVPYMSFGSGSISILLGGGGVPANYRWMAAAPLAGVGTLLAASGATFAGRRPGAIYGVTAGASMMALLFMLSYGGSVAVTPTAQTLPGAWIAIGACAVALALATVIHGVASTGGEAKPHAPLAYPGISAAVGVAAAPIADKGDRDPGASVDASDMKTCPDCAEEVRAAARVCRFCGFRFD